MLGGRAGGDRAEEKAAIVDEGITPANKAQKSRADFRRPCSLFDHQK